MTTTDPWIDLVDLLIRSSTEIAHANPEERRDVTIAVLNRIEQAATRCDIMKIETPRDALSCTRAAIESLAKSPHPPHTTAMRVLGRVLTVLEAPTLANEAKMMHQLSVVAQNYQAE